MPASPLARLRKLCLALPEAHEVEAWGAPTFRVKNKLFAMYASPSSSHTGGHAAVWVKATPVNQSFMIAHDPKRFFSPPYVGTSGWVGVRLDGRVNWSELGDLLRDAYELTAPVRKRDPAARSLPKTTTKPTKPTAKRAHVRTSQNSQRPRR